MKYVPFIPIALIIIGCSVNQKPGDSGDIDTSVKQALRDGVTVKKHNPRQIANKPQRKWLFNGEEFIVQGRVVVVGANVYNVTLAQYGVIREHMYVTLKPEVSEAWLRKFLKGNKVKTEAKMSKSIYRLTFEPGTEIYTLYQRLIKANEVKSAEISVFYNSSDREVM